MPSPDDTQLLAAAADARSVADDARVLREDLRWAVKPGDADRERQIAAALDALDVAMKPLRSAIGQFAWGLERRESTEVVVRAASATLQYERKQLKKMRR